MKTCPFCLKEIQDDAIFCRYCSRALSKPSNSKPIYEGYWFRDSLIALGVFIVFVITLFVLAEINTGVPTPNATPIPVTSYRSPTNIISSPTATLIPPTPLPLVGCAGQYSLRIRTAPSTQASILGGISPGECVSIFRRNEDSSWVWIKTGDMVGWMLAENLSIKGEIIQLSVVNENGGFEISQLIFPTATTAFPTTTNLPVRTSTPLPRIKTSTPRPLPTTTTLLCKDTYNMVGSTVKCKIPRAYCSYQYTTSGRPTFCNDAQYPNHNFILVVWGSDWSDLDGRCIIVSGRVSFYDGKPQIEASNRSQVTYWQ